MESSQQLSLEASLLLFINYLAMWNDECIMLSYGTDFHSSIKWFESFQGHVLKVVLWKETAKALQR